ncbi:MAG: hypothetical protein KTR16_07565 [Acidiferrobacterales bacterium]|nr:hypothetical protein [Acidiferrobacterales bacterium]
MSNNLLSMSAESEQAVSALALSYELETGKRVKWRKSETDVFDMISEALESTNAELSKKARYVLSVLDCGEKLRESSVSGGGTASVNRTYRGIKSQPAVVDVGQKSEASQKRKKVRVYRGAVQH